MTPESDVPPGSGVAHDSDVTPEARRVDPDGAPKARRVDSDSVLTGPRAEAPTAPASATPATAPPPRLKHRIEYAAFVALRGFLSILPARIADELGGMLGGFVGTLLRIRRDVVDENLRLAFPDENDRWRRRVGRASYRHLVREAIATFRMGSTDRETILARTTLHGDVDGLMAAVEAGNGAIIVTGHLGNWEIGGASVAVRGVPVDAVALVQANRLFDREIVETRGRLGMTVMPRGHAHRLALKSIRQGRVPALVADQNARKGGVFVDFFGIPAATAKGAAVFALRTGAPLFLGVSIRRPVPSLSYDVHLERIPAEVTGDMDADVERVTQAHTAALEMWVRRHPEQYFWHHKRWKTRPDTGTGLHPVRY